MGSGATVRTGYANILLKKTNNEIKLMNLQGRLKGLWQNKALKKRWKWSRKKINVESTDGQNRDSQRLKLNRWELDSTLNQIRNKQIER